MSIFARNIYAFLVVPRACRCHLVLLLSHEWIIWYELMV